MAFMFLSLIFLSSALERIWPVAVLHLWVFRASAVLDKSPATNDKSLA
jgi:hypothetical protein